jgi:dTDP-4-amino-4,6-dideoxygalactose transaminase
MCSHREDPYRDHEGRFPQSEQAQDTGIILPLHPTMTASNIEGVVNALRRAIEARL